MMRIGVGLGLMAAAALSLGGAAGAQDKPALRAASFAKDVLPILKTSCSKCHSGNNAKSKLDLTSYAAVQKGSKDGPVVVAGDPDKSSLVSSISGDKPDMPKKANPLSKSQVQIIAIWVKEGAKNN
jgi:hypothetical protein